MSPKRTFATPSGTLSDAATSATEVGRRHSDRTEWNSTLNPGALQGASFRTEIIASMAKFRLDCVRPPVRTYGRTRVRCRSCRGGRRAAGMLGMVASWDIRASAAAEGRRAGGREVGDPGVARRCSLRGRSSCRLPIDFLPPFLCRRKQSRRRQRHRGNARLSPPCTAERVSESKGTSWIKQEGTFSRIMCERMSPPTSTFYLSSSGSGVPVGTSSVGFSVSPPSSASGTASKDGAPAGTSCGSGLRLTAVSSSCATSTISTFSLA